eukprot:11205230-Lingulodinium_polyedra.AAC.1
MQPPTRTQEKIAAENLSTRSLSRVCQTASKLRRYVERTAWPRKHGDARPGEELRRSAVSA